MLLIGHSGLFLRNAPHLSNRLALVTPLYAWTEVPYVFAGLKLYDVLSGSMNIGRSILIGDKEALRRFPHLKRDGLKAAVIYYDGQFDDARMGVSLALTARQQGAAVINQVEVTALEKAHGRICGARVRDRLGGEAFGVRARAEINAAGPFVDRVRQMDQAGVPPIVHASSGVHITLPGRFVPEHAGLLIPKTDDGRVLFILPWQGHALIGTTDLPGWAIIMGGWQGVSPRSAYGEEAKGRERRRSSGSERAWFLGEESELRTEQIFLGGENLRAFEPIP